MHSLHDRIAFKQFEKARPIEKIGRPCWWTIDLRELSMEVRGHPTFPIQYEVPTLYPKRVDSSDWPKDSCPNSTFRPRWIGKDRGGTARLEKRVRRTGTGTDLAIGFPYGDDPQGSSQSGLHFRGQTREPKP